MSDEVYCMDCWFEGHVQGVGFRYQTLAVAKGFEVTGSVRNLPDGRVHLVAEGDEAEVRAFQEAVADELDSYIRKIELQGVMAARRCVGFRIKH
ncbi:acylphosphatase [Coraliomargarita akajimensis]|uniref:acylphosphatase n=1 Tax=Coraliomargarita akajimensis (strain DSM 45221 / IAM 15411 / JCM 23193 / KCTC 12865 / 04OKA010-24) TaxID=583355 RepID=D5EPS8_CORAD|nr:acylphosphatase [Coraliomargarita akajimensis]ADE55661.1 acylphosphatase [Coraliomargarita akajimensis DSM 45221]